LFYRATHSTLKLYTCLAHTCAQVLFACGWHASFACIHLRSLIFAYGPLGGCAHASLNMWVHAYLFCAIYSKRWALISFSGICLPACYCIAGYTLTIPPPHTLPSYTFCARIGGEGMGRENGESPNIPRFLFSRPRPLGGDSPPQSWARGGDTYDCQRRL